MTEPSREVAEVLARAVNNTGVARAYVRTVAESDSGGPPAPLLCWCCARWGLTTEAFDGRERMCLPCLNSTRSDCNTRHLAQALAAAS